MTQHLQSTVARWSAALLFFACSAAASHAQGNQAKLLQQANADFENGGWNAAAVAYEELEFNAGTDLAAHGKYSFLAGEAHRMSNNFEKAIELFEKAVYYKYQDKDEQVFLSYGDALLALEEFDEAINMYSRYKNAGGSASVEEGRRMQADEAARVKEDSRGRYMVEPRILLNSDMYDMTPLLTGKKQDELIFASTKKGTLGDDDCAVTGGQMFDLYFSEQDKKGRWSSPQSLGNTICTEDHHESSPVYDDGMKTIYFTRCVGKKCDIYKAKKQGTKFGASELIELVNRMEDDSTNIAHPALFEDEYLIFSSNMGGGEGDVDLWYVYGEDGDFSGATPINLGPTINTAGKELFPYIREDGNLYWSTDGRAGLGGLDLWMATRVEVNGGLEFTEPQRLPYPINSSSDDFSITYLEDEDAGMIASNRPGGKGKDDLYSFRLLPLEFCYQAFIYNDETGFPLSEVTVTLTSGDGESYSYTTDEEGELYLCEGEIEESQSYNVEIELDGFIRDGDKFSTSGLNESTNFAREYFLKEIVLNKAYDLPQVLYPLGSAELLNDATVNSADSLGVLVDLLKRNENLVIQLDSHTDSRGSASSNKSLSQARAQTCVDFLIAKGISSDRLVAKGYGEDEPKVTDAEIAALPEEEQEAAHQKNRRTEFRVIRFDYKPSGN